MRFISNKMEMSRGQENLPMAVDDKKPWVLTLGFFNSFGLAQK